MSGAAAIRAAMIRAAMIRAVVFDVGGVLLRLGEWEYRREIARWIGLGLESPLASAPLLPAEYEENVPLLQRGELAEEVLWSRVAGRPVAFSCEIGCRKPEAGAFRWVLDRLRLPREAVAYVDDVPEYVEAAARLGMRAVLHRDDAEATRGAVLELAGVSSRHDSAVRTMPGPQSGVAAPDASH